MNAALNTLHRCARLGLPPPPPLIDSPSIALFAIAGRGMSVQVPPLVRNLTQSVGSLDAQSPGHRPPDYLDQFGIAGSEDRFRRCRGVATRDSQI